MEEIHLNQNRTEYEFLNMAQDCMERITSKNQEIKECKMKYQLTLSKVAEIYGCYQKLKRYIVALANIDSNIDFLINEIDYDLFNVLFNESKENDNVPFRVNITFDEEEEEE